MGEYHLVKTYHKADKVYDETGNLLFNWFREREKKKEPFFREALLKMGVPEHLICVERIDKLKDHLDIYDLHFQHIIPYTEPGEALYTKGNEYIICVRNNMVEYLKEIVV